MKGQISKLVSALLVAGVATTAIADDGVLVRKSLSKNDPTLSGHLSEAEHAFVDMMKFYVPAQAANGSVQPIDYYEIDGALESTRNGAKPLIGVYIYGPSEGVDGVGFVGHGRREAYGAVSLDDGLTWKTTNLSESSDLSSSDVIRDDIGLFDDLEGAYPGDVVNIFQATAGNYTLAVWPSRYCSGGSPNYSLENQHADKLASIADYMGIEMTIPVVPGDSAASPDDLYLIDMFGVAGSQGSVDYAEDKFEQNRPVGEVPYNCLWAARGVLVSGDDPRTEATESSYLRWFKAERLTSGRRDVNRVEAKCVEGAGCAITWQEDPEGLRGGQGEGPGEGWSGAVANSKTDVWYSYIDWEHFALVEDPADDTVILSFADYEVAAVDTENVTQKPQVGIPFAMPMAITDNGKCNTTNPLPYCNGSAIQADHTDVLNPLDYGMVDMCADTVEIPTGRQGTLSEICVTEYGMPLVGNVAATRPRLGLFGYDSDGDSLTDSAFAVVQAEESKGLGAFGFDLGIPCTPEDDGDECIPFDEGKNLWYYSFNFELTGDDAGGFTSKEELDSLLANLGGHGNQLNQPEVDWMTGEFYPVANTVDFWDFGDYNYDVYNTEIARRGSLLAQDIAKVSTLQGSTARSSLLAMPAWKQGIMKQGGPADVMVRRILLPRGWVPGGQVNGNPYAFRNMDCKDWAYGRGKDGTPENAFYPDGLCLDPAINLSASIPDTCTDSTNPDTEIPCPTVDVKGGSFGIGDTNPVLQGGDVTPNTTKVLTWHQCPADFTTVSGETVTCKDDARSDDSTLADQSWYNPLDVAKGHRGYLDGDFVMMLYAWSPNWRLNAKGNDRYELYIRRSFDGGETWTTLPSGYKHYDNTVYNGAGTTTCETYRTAETGDGSGTDVDGKVEPVVCNAYKAGKDEQARNVTQLKSMRFTTLDPRYAPTAASIVDGTGYSYDVLEDIRDPSRYAIVFETGDNRTTAIGEAEPLDLYYGRAVMFGDHYQVWAEEDDLSVCYPSDPHDNEVAEEKIGSGFCNEFDQMEQGTPGLEASEASLEANPGGEFIYGAWSQLQIDELTGEPVDSDADVRRIHYIDDYIPSDAWDFGQGTGDGTPAN